ncbi:PepSY domain-containing protein [Shimia aestuarii]|uniref:PepSY domain-containing protein n=1 Tax=Shimia aestuarii TaxID=254406 RepID=UPI001FB41AE8|nr:PepSY domain-containing protein [Shimia aestuarii]
MLKPLTLAACMALAAPISAQASSDDSYDYARLTPETKAQIRAQLTEKGYEVRKIKMDDGYYEAYALKDGARLEIYLDKDLKIVKTKSDD